MLIILTTPSQAHQSTSVTGCVRRLVGWSATQTFDNPHGAPTWASLQSAFYERLKKFHQMS